MCGERDAALAEPVIARIQSAAAAAAPTRRSGSGTNERRIAVRQSRNLGKA
jgi:hypothetical protein